MARFNCENLGQVTKIELRRPSRRSTPPREVTEADLAVARRWWDSLPQETLDDDAPLPIGSLFEMLAESRGGQVTLADVIAVQRAQRRIVLDQFREVAMSCAIPKSER